MPQPRAIVPDGATRPAKNSGATEIPLGTIVKFSGEGTIVPSAAATDDHYGVTMYRIPAGAIGDVQVTGKAIVRAGAALATPGTWLTADASGRAVAATIDASSLSRLIGQQVSISTAVDQLIEVELRVNPT